jgi:scyllo-inositol 2-dehydrogenase (NAD+)
MIMHLIASSHTYCQVGFMRRFDPGYRAAWEQIRQGVIGTPLYFKTISRDPGCPPASYLKECGRIFVDMGVHDFDLARFLLNEEIVEVTALGGVVHHEWLRMIGDSDQALTFVRFASGALGDIETSRVAGYGYDTRAEIVGTEGTIQVDALAHHGIRVVNSRGYTSDIVPNFIKRFATAYSYELIGFIDHLRRGLPPSVTVEDGYKALAVAMAAIQSFDEHRPVAVKQV